MVKRFSEFLTETVKNLIGDDKDKLKYVDQVWDLLQAAYKPIGGIAGNGFKDKEDMIKNIGFWKLVLRGDKVTAVDMYKTKDGRKLTAIATDGTSQGRSDLAMLLRDDMLTGRAYGELSGPALKFVSKIFGSDTKKYFVPVDIVKKVLFDDEIKEIDEFRYERKIGGQWHEKIMLGNATLSKHY